MSNDEDPRFTEWWNKHLDPDETGRGRMLAHHGFLAGLAYGATPVKIKLRGGHYDGQQMEVTSALETIGFPHIAPNHDWALPVTSESRKRHSWDDDALTVATDYYRRTGLLENGLLVYELKT